MKKSTGDFSYEIKDTFGVCGFGGGNWATELNLISWNGAAPKYDIRKWTDDHEKMGKGISLTKSELEGLYELLRNIFEDEEE